MKLEHCNHKPVILALCLMASGSFANAQNSPPHCPTPTDLKNMQLTLGDLKEVSPPHWEVTASGFPYFVEGEWTLGYKILTIDNRFQWRISTKKESAATPEQVLSRYELLLSNLPNPHLHIDYGYWWCEYGYSGVAAQFLYTN